MFSIKCDQGIDPKSFASNSQVYMNPEHFLPFQRFLPKPKVEGGQKRQGGGGGDRGGRGGFGGGRGGFRGN